MMHSTKAGRRAIKIDPTLLTNPPDFNDPGEYTRRHKAAMKKAKEELRAERKARWNPRKETERQEKPEEEKTFMEEKNMTENNGNRGDWNGGEEKIFISMQTVDEMAKEMVERSEGKLSVKEAREIACAILQWAGLIEERETIGLKDFNWKVVDAVQQEISGYIDSWAGKEPEGPGLEEVIDMKQLKLVTDMLPGILDAYQVKLDGISNRDLLVALAVLTGTVRMYEDATGKKEP